MYLVSGGSPRNVGGVSRFNRRLQQLALACRRRRTQHNKSALVGCPNARCHRDATFRPSTLMTDDSTPTVPVSISSLSSSQEEEVHINITTILHTTPEARMHALQGIFSRSPTNIATGCYLVCATWYALLVAWSLSCYAAVYTVVNVSR